MPKKIIPTIHRYTCDKCGLETDAEDTRMVPEGWTSIYRLRKCRTKREERYYCEPCYLEFCEVWRKWDGSE